MGAVNYDMKVRTPSHIGLNSRSGPGINYRRIGGLGEGAVVHCTEVQNGWYRHGGGWSSGNYLVLIKDYGTSSSTQPPNPPPVPKPYVMTEAEKAIVNGVYKSVDAKSTGVDDIKYLHGAPFQFTATTDPRPSGSGLGRAYMETLLDDMSMLVITPGKSKFMTEFSDEASKSLLNGIFGNKASEQDKSSLEKVLTGKEAGRYYSFESDYVDYMRYVNNMCRIASIMLGIGDEKLFDGAKPYKDFDWDIANMKSHEQSKLFGFLNLEKSVAFYIDAKASSFSDGMSNSTDSSMLEGALSKGSDVAKEALFLFGKGYQDQSVFSTSQANYENAVQKVIKSLTSDDSLIRQVTDRVSDHAASMLNGGNVAFPQIWKDSSYNKSYDITMKFVCPYADVESFYLYILVPVFHIIAFTYPRQLGANGYLNPFLIRAFCKGWFNCTMGIVDSVNIKRASQEGWSVHGFPTEVEVTISIKDLYENLTISRVDDYSTFHNTEFMDMISTWCGVNINKPELVRKFSLYAAFTKNKITSFIPNITDQFKQDVASKLNEYFK